MTSSLMTAPVDELQRQARIRFRLTPDHDSLLDDFARSIADEIKAGNARGEPTRLILPVGPVAHYPTLVETCNRERISWANVHTFNMDEFLDWQGRPIPISHPLSFEGYMRREVFAKLDEELRIPSGQTWFPDPFRIGEISEAIAARRRASTVATAASATTATSPSTSRLSPAGTRSLSTNCVTHKPGC